MKKKNYLILLVFILPLVLRAQGKGEYFPKKLLLQPFAANIFEPRLGFDFNLEKSSVELNISNSVEIYERRNGKVFYAVGADLFTFTRLRREKEFHFPVDAIDYLFGLNFVYLNNTGSFGKGVRVRLSHISAHFADGHFDNYTHSWHDNLPPVVYSREFIEITPFVVFNDFRFYSTAAYIYHIDPDYLGRDYYQVGFDYFSSVFSPAKNLTPFLGYDLRLVHLQKYVVAHSIKAGLKFGKRRGRGISLYFSFFSGYSFHGEYFTVKRNIFSVGFNLDI